MANETNKEAPIPAYDFLDDTLLRKLNREVKHAAGGAKSEMFVKDFGPIVSIFDHTEHGLRCSVCGALQDGAPDVVIACQQCGLALRTVLYIGF